MKQLSLFNFAPDQKNAPASSNAAHWKLWVDGAARKNPGPAGAGIVIAKRGKVIQKNGFYLGPRTNNQAEYFAVLLGLFLLKKRIQPDDIVTIISDSQLLVRQFKGEYKIKHPELKPLHRVAQELLRGMHYIFEHVMREDNTKADYMANQGIDERIAMPEEFKKLLKQHDID